MPSIVDPSCQVGGAWTVTRVLLRMLRNGPLQGEVEVVAVPHRSRASQRIRQCIAVGKSLVSGLPAKIEFSRSRALLSRVNHLGRRQFDLAILNGTDLMWLLPHLPANTPRVVIAHNIEHQLFASQIRGRLNSRLAGALLRRDQQKLRKYEIESLSQAGNVIFLSSLDQEYARNQCSGLRSIVLPPMFESPPVTRLPRKVGAVLHMGMLANFAWWPNREGFEWFLTGVFPHLSPRVQLHLFGKDSDRIAPNHPRIQRHGYVADLAEVWGACDFMVCPVISGGGVSVKVAEALYNGMPLVGSRFSARGLPLDPDPSIVLLDGAEDWIQFLNSGAEGLAGRTVPRSIADRFSVATHSGAFSTFLSESL